jgi:hypothetical protein
MAWANDQHGWRIVTFVCFPLAWMPATPQRPSRYPVGLYISSRSRGACHARGVGLVVT